MERAVESTHQATLADDGPGGYQVSKGEDPNDPEWWERFVDG